MMWEPTFFKSASGLPYFPLSSSIPTSTVDGLDTSKIELVYKYFYTVLYFNYILLTIFSTLFTKLNSLALSTSDTFVV